MATRSAALQHLLAHVDSCEKLLLVRHLVRAPAAAHSASDVARALHADVAVASAVLESCVETRLLRRSTDGTFVFDPDEDVRAGAMALVELYEQDPAAVLQAMSVRSIERVRRLAAAMAAVEGDAAREDG